MSEHQQELSQKARHESERQHDQVLKDERERHTAELDRLEKRARQDESKAGHSVQSLESRLQQMQAELVNAQAESKQQAYALSQEKLAHLQT